MGQNLYGGRVAGVGASSRRMLESKWEWTMEDGRNYDIMKMEIRGWDNSGRDH